MASRKRVSQSTKRPLEGSQKITTLPPLLRHFIGLHLQVELKNGLSYHGTLHEADDYMNLVLRRASPAIADKVHDGSLSNHSSSSASLSQHTLLKSHMDSDAVSSLDLPSLDPSYYQLLHLRGPSIRYVHFPSNADLPTLIKLGQDRQRSAQNRYKRGKRK